MQSLTIPKQDRRIIALLTSVESSTLQSLVSGLNHIEPRLHPESDISELVNSLKLESTEVNDNLANTLRRLFLTRVTYDHYSDADFINAVVAGFKKEDDSDQIPQSDAITRVLTNLLGVNNLKLSYKATSLIYERERFLSRSRLIVDLRPIFSAAGEVIEAFTFIYSLHLDYFQNQTHQDIELALDDDDIENLSNSLSRIRRKKKALMKQADEKGLPIIEERR